MTALRIVDGSRAGLPVDTVTQSMAILARRGAGKTYAASVIVEEVVGASVPVVVLDPTGAWWGLRSSADGTSAGLPVVIFGGDHGDVPLEQTAGALLADVVIDHPGAYVLDLSSLLSKAAEQRFAADFLERLYRAKKRDSGPLLLVVDEADVFAPQRPGPEQARTLGALESIVRRGRIKGLGDLLITQRAAVLNKNVLTQTEILFVMQTTGPQDRAAIDAWIEGNGTADQRAEVLSSLASMERGEAWLWSPSFLRTLKRIRIRQRRTFDSSRTPVAGEHPIAPRAFAKVDLERLGARIAATVDKSKADDPKELRRRVAELERQLAARPTEVQTVTVDRVVEVPVLNGQIDELRAALGQLDAIGGAILTAGEQLTKAIDRVVARPAAPAAAPQPRPAPARPPAIVDQSWSATLAATEVQIDAGARRMLAALAKLHPTPLTRAQLGTLTELPWSGSTFRAYLSRLRVAGLIVEPDKSTVALSPAGVSMMADQLGSGAPTVEELVDMWNRKLDAGARRMLRVLVDIYPDGIDRATLGDRVELPASGSTFRAYLSRLRVNRLLDESGGLVRAGDALFIGAGR